jgi:hypothetical protein
VSASGSELRSRTQRVRSSRQLGEYVEYGEPWRRSLLVIGVWLAAGAVFVIAAGTASASVECFNTYCRHTSADEARQGDYLSTFICFVGASVFIWRRLFRRPGVRLGQLGFEIRTQLLKHQFVRWQDVGVVYPSRRRRFFWRTMAVGLVHSAVAEGSPAVVTVRLSGLSTVPSEIEAEITERVKQAHPRQHHLAQPRTVADDGHALHGICVATSDGETHNGVTSAELLDILASIGPDNAFALLTEPGSRDDQHYIQASLAGDGEWHVEYRDGGPDRHYGAECHDVEAVHRILVGWADDSGEWRTRLPWYQMEMEH